MVLCPECESDLDVAEDEVEEGDVLSCAECGSDFEVVGSDPLQLVLIAKEDDEEKSDEESEDDDA